jgi:hypothetical protein
MTIDEEHLNRIRAVAAEHDGRYLLPRRLIEGSDSDLEWQACEELVRAGEAVWLTPYNRNHPGIIIVRPPAPKPEPEPEMSLDKALHILAQAHTTDDSLAGFSMHIGTRAYDFWDGDRASYYRAWRAVRRHLHLQVDPPDRKS